MSDTNVALAMAMSVLRLFLAIMGAALWLKRFDAFDIAHRTADGRRRN